MLEPLFNAMGFDGVTVLHHSGKREKGKDMFFFDKDRFGNLTFYAVVACAGKIHADSKKTNDSGHYRKIIDQVSKCYLYPYEEPNLKGTFYVDKVIIACPSSITDDAMDALRIWEKDNHRHLIYLTGPRIAGLKIRLSVGNQKKNLNGPLVG